MASAAMARNPSKPARRVRVRCKGGDRTGHLEPGLRGPEPAGLPVHCAAMVERRPRRPGDNPPRRSGDTTRFTIAAVVGSVAALGVFWVLLARTPSIFGGILDAQARALLHGHWNI